MCCPSSPVAPPARPPRPPEPGCPRSAPALAEGARLFGDVRYGGHEPTASGHEALAALDAQVRAARPAAPVPS